MTGSLTRRRVAHTARGVDACFVFFNSSFSREFPRRVGQIGGRATPYFRNRHTFESQFLEDENQWLSRAPLGHSRVVETVRVCVPAHGFAKTPRPWERVLGRETRVVGVGVWRMLGKRRLAVRERQCARPPLPTVECPPAQCAFWHCHASSRACGSTTGSVYSALLAQERDASDKAGEEPHSSVSTFWGVEEYFC